MATVDRFAEGYVPDFDIDAEVGHQGELLAGNIIDSLKAGSVEVKTDEKALKYSNVFLETECLKGGKYVLSGVASSPSETYIHVVSSVAVAMPMVVARAVARRGYKTGYRRECKRGSHPTKGAAVPFEIFYSWAIEEAEAAGGRS